MRKHASWRMAKRTKSAEWLPAPAQTPKALNEADGAGDSDDEGHGDLDKGEATRDDVSPSQQEEPDEDHTRESEEEAGKSAPAAELARIETGDDGNPAGKGLHLVAQRAVTHCAYDVECDEDHEAAPADCLETSSHGEIQPLLDWRGQEVDVDEHGSADEGRDQPDEEWGSVFAAAQNGHEDDHGDANAESDNAADLQAFDFPDLLMPAFFAEQLDGGLGTLPGGLGDAPEGFGPVKRFALLAAVVHPSRQG